MITFIDAKEILEKNPDLTHHEVYYDIFLGKVKEYEKEKNLKNPKWIMGEGLGDIFEIGDYGDPTYYALGMETPPRCGRGYYAQFWVSTSVQDHALIIAHDDGFDSFVLLNSPNEVPRYSPSDGYSGPPETCEDQ